jgi:hypothetical protein
MQVQNGDIKPLTELGIAFITFWGYCGVRWRRVDCNIVAMDL